MKECLFEKYGFEKDERVELIDSYNHAVLGRVLVKDSTLMHNATIKSFAWVIWDLQGKFINSLGSDNHSLIKFNLKKLDNNETYKGEMKMESESKKNTNYGMKYTKTILIKSGYIEATILEEYKGEKTVFDIGDNIQKRIVCYKVFGNAFGAVLLKTSKKRNSRLLIEANKWADEYIEAIKSGECRGVIVREDGIKEKLIAEVK